MELIIRRGTKGLDLYLSFLRATGVSVQIENDYGAYLLVTIRLCSHIINSSIKLFKKTERSIRIFLSVVFADLARSVTELERETVCKAFQWNGLILYQ